MLDRKLINALNVVSLCKDIWPVRGGLLDQSVNFVNLKQRLEADESQIQAHQMERK